ncbi:MAG: hypothetical protein RMN25_13660, partial [Anaerolineae bacterium]|nr:hypothetical protein [Thermoflexales bacterium]MDW8408819.1 hypothetical protein [Anaerolineae bacterium]
MTNQIIRRLAHMVLALCWCVVVLCAAPFCTARSAYRILAQETDSVWGPAVNLSSSGTATAPGVVAAPDGVLYAWWWDAIDGAKYASRSVTDTVWSPPRPLPFVFGARDEEPSRTGGPPRIVLSEPRAMRLYAGAQGALSVVWQNSVGALFNAALVGGRWTNPTLIADLSGAFDAIVSSSQALHLVYVAPAARVGFPAGIYHVVRTVRGWSRPHLTYPSLYFRSVQEPTLNISVASRDDRHIVIVWDDPMLGRSVFTHSSDGGETWSQAAPLAESPTALTVQGAAAFAPNGEAMLVWRDPTVSTCRIFQRRASAQLSGWSSPHIVLGDISLCPDRWSFMPASDGRLWMIGASTPVATGSVGADLPVNIANRIVLAAWDGQQWSSIVLSGPRVVDAAAGGLRELSCLTAA